MVNTSKRSVYTSENCYIDTSLTCVAVVVVAGAPEEVGATEEEACTTDEEAAGATNEEAGAVKRGRLLVFFILLLILLAPENNVTHRCQILTFRMRNIHDQSFKLFGKKGKKQCCYQLN